MFYLEGDENLKHKAVSGFDAVHYYSQNDFSLTLLTLYFEKLERLVISMAIIALKC